MFHNMEVIGWNLLDLIRWALAMSSELSKHESTRVELVRTYYVKDYRVL